MKRIWISIAAGALVLCAAACGGHYDPSVSPGLETAPLATASPVSMETLPPAVPAAAVADTPAVTATETPPATASPPPEETEQPAGGGEWIVKAVTLLQPVTAYVEPDGTSETLPAGTELMVDAGGEGEWLEGKLGTETIWLHLSPDSGFEIETPDGWLFLWVAVDGLDFTD